MVGSDILVIVGCAFVGSSRVLDSVKIFNFLARESEIDVANERSSILKRLFELKTEKLANFYRHHRK